jgi:hypothetical protein
MASLPSVDLTTGAFRHFEMLECSVFGGKQLQSFTPNVVARDSTHPLLILLQDYKMYSYFMVNFEVVENGGFCLLH